MHKYWTVTSSLNPYSGFVNPVLVPETNDAGEIVDVKVTQPESFEMQMMQYAKMYSFLD